jgi:predicted ATP-dependent serine protease
VVRGEAGIGKTTLLAYARERAEGLIVLAAVGVESEAGTRAACARARSLRVCSPPEGRSANEPAVVTLAQDAATPTR